MAWRLRADTGAAGVADRPAPSVLGATTVAGPPGGPGSPAGPGGPGGPGEAAPPSGTTTLGGVGGPGVGSGPSGPGGPAFAPQPDRRFTWVGATRGAQFTDDELATLARDYDVVVIAKFHGGWDIEAAHEAARRLVALRPDIRVFPYFSAKYWFEQNEWGLDIDPDWFLRDRDGNPVPRVRPREGRQVAAATYVDLTNPDYRDWALGVMADWLGEAPYAGIAFDAAVPIGLGDEENQREWNGLLGPERVADYNEGMRDLLAAAQRLVGPDRTTLYNGIAPNAHLKDADRNVGLLDVAGGAMDERFCIDVRGDIHSVDEDLRLMGERADAGDELFMRVNFRDGMDPAQRPRLERFCLGVFMLGWQPGHSYFDRGSDYTAAQLHDAVDPAADPQMNLGQPTGPFTRQGDVAERRFEHGRIYVNLGSAPVDVMLPVPLATMSSGGVLTSQAAGSVISVAADDAAFLLDPAFTAGS